MGVADDIPEPNFEFRINTNTIIGSGNKSIIEMREYQHIDIVILIFRYIILYSILNMDIEYHYQFI